MDEEQEPVQKDVALVVSSMNDEVGNVDDDIIFYVPGKD